MSTTFDPSSSQPLPATSNNALPPGSVVGDFTIQGLVGEGGFGIVYRAFDNGMQDDDFCRAFGITPPKTQPPVKSRVPALLISGTHDPRTPPDRAASTARDLAGSEHVIVQNGGHELLPVSEVQDLVLAFLDGEISEAEAKERTITGTRRFARRQDSWFRKDPRVTWTAYDDPARVHKALAAVDRVR